MNTIDKFLAKIPLNEVAIQTNIDSVSVIERIEFAVKPAQRSRQRSHYYSFEGSYYGNYFRIQGHLMNPDGSEVFPKGIVYISVGFIGFPLRIETSPTFYGRVFDDGDGSTIKGHFALPFPILSLLIVLLFFYLGKLFPQIESVISLFSFFLVIWSITSLVEFFIERKAIIDFLKGLLFDVTAPET